jgi:hypothetical protein
VKVLAICGNSLNFLIIAGNGQICKGWCGRHQKVILISQGVDTPADWEMTPVSEWQIFQLD